MSRRLIVLCMAALLAACSSTSAKHPDATIIGSHEPSNPIVRARLHARVDNIRYQRGMTLISNLEHLANYGEVAIPTLMKGLESSDAMTRMGCAWVLGRIGNTTAIPALSKLLTDDVAFVRYEAASQVCTLGSKAGYRVLVDGLKDDRVEYRFKCIEALRQLTGQDFGFVHNGSTEERERAVTKWQAWLERIESEDV